MQKKSQSYTDFIPFFSVFLLLNDTFSEIFQGETNIKKKKNLKNEVYAENDKQDTNTRLNNKKLSVFHQIHRKLKLRGDLFDNDTGRLKIDNFRTVNDDKRPLTQNESRGF